MGRAGGTGVTGSFHSGVAPVVMPFPHAQKAACSPSWSHRLLADTPSPAPCPVPPPPATAFGAPHTAQRYSPASGPGWNYLWALGATPHGPLSSLTTLSVASGAAVGRNLALAELERHVGRVAAVLHVRRWGLGVSAVHARPAVSCPCRAWLGTRCWGRWGWVRGSLGAG